MYIVIDDSAQSIPQNCSVISFGSIWLSKESIIKIEKEILNLRMETNCWGEFKWTNVDDNHFSIYKSLLDIFLNDDNVKFNSIIQQVPSKAELKEFHGGSNETAKMKQIFNLVFYNYGNYRNNFCLGKKLTIIADKPFLQKGEAKDVLLEKLSSPTKIPIGKAITVDSKILGILQMSDVLTGLSLANVIHELFKKELGIDKQKADLIDYLKGKIDISPHLHGKPSPQEKCNNWFHRPGVAWNTIRHR